MDEDINSLLWRISEIEERPYKAPWDPWRYNEALAVQLPVLKQARTFAKVHTSSAFSRFPALYEPREHAVYVPPSCAFRDANLYASVLLHELAHWTMKPLRRPQGNVCLNDWHREELVAETTGRQMAKHLGYQVPEWSDYYLRGHMENITQNKQDVFDYVGYHAELATELLKKHFNKAMENYDAY